MQGLQVSKSILGFRYLESGDNCGWQGGYVPKCRRFTQTRNKPADSYLPGDFEASWDEAAGVRQPRQLHRISNSTCCARRRATIVVEQINQRGYRLLGTFTARRIPSSVVVVVVVVVVDLEDF